MDERRGSLGEMSFANSRRRTSSFSGRIRGAWKTTHRGEEFFPSMTKKPEDAVIERLRVAHKRIQDALLERKRFETRLEEIEGFVPQLIAWLRGFHARQEAHLQATLEDTKIVATDPPAWYQANKFPNLYAELSLELKDASARILEDLSQYPRLSMIQDMKKMLHRRRVRMQSMSVMRASAAFLPGALGGLDPNDGVVSPKSEDVSWTGGGVAVEEMQSDTVALGMKPESEMDEEEQKRYSQIVQSVSHQMITQMMIGTPAKRVGKVERTRFHVAFLRLSPDRRIVFFGKVRKEDKTPVGDLGCTNPMVVGSMKSIEAPERSVSPEEERLAFDVVFTNGSRVEVVCMNRANTVVWGDGLRHLMGLRMQYPETLRDIALMSLVEDEQQRLREEARQMNKAVVPSSPVPLDVDRFETGGGFLVPESVLEVAVPPPVPRVTSADFLSTVGSDDEDMDLWELGEEEEGEREEEVNEDDVELFPLGDDDDDDR